MHTNEPKTHLRVLAAFTCIALLLAVTPTQSASAEVLERIAAVVNDEVIWLSDLRKRATPFMSQLANIPEEQRPAQIDQLYAQLLEVAINEHLVGQAARQMQIRVSAEDINRAISNVKQQSGLDDVEFWAAVRGQGFSDEQYRNDVRKQLVRLKVLNQRVRARVEITEEDVRAKYDQELREARRTSIFRASHVFLPLTQGASATDVAALRTRAEGIRSEIDADTFEDAMAQYGGGDLGTLRQGSLPRALEDVLLALSPGEISEPVVGETGVHIFLLHSREQAAANIPPYEEVRDRVYQHMTEEAMGRQERVFLQELERNAVISRRL